MTCSSPNAASKILARRIAEIDRDVQDKLAVIAAHRKPIELAESVIADAKLERDALAVAIGLIEGAQGA